MKHILVVFLLFFLLVEGASAATTQERWALMNVTGHLPNLQFKLMDDNGRIVTGQTYTGSVVLLYFGFTHCPDQCPMTLSGLAMVLRDLSKDAAYVRVLFVTTDPEHDNPKTMHDFLASFNTSQITGLTGNADNIAELAKSLRAAYRPGSPSHSNAIYIFDMKGHARLLATPDDPEAAFIHDIRQLLHESH